MEETLLKVENNEELEYSLSLEKFEYVVLLRYCFHLIWNFIKFIIICSINYYLKSRIWTKLCICFYINIYLLNHFKNRSQYFLKGLGGGDYTLEKR